MKFRQLLYAKIHGGTVTECNLQYEGSCGLGPDLLQASGIVPLEKISVLNISTGGRLETYAIRAHQNCEISLNGAAARHATPGDKVIILAFVGVPNDEVDSHGGQVVILGAGNKVVNRRIEKAML